MNERFSHRLELISAWCDPAFLLGLVVFFGIFGHILPAPLHHLWMQPGSTQGLSTPSAICVSAS